jgi:hypothetical protein
LAAFGRPIFFALLKTPLLFLALLGLGAVTLLQGMGGTFVIDDYDNLTDLEQISANPSWDQYLQFILNGVSSPLGRPLAMATFAAQHASWPKHPGDFIYVNVLLHLLNACLVFGCFLRLLALAPPSNPRAAHGIALAATGLWLFAAPQAAAVLYVVQRMAELSGTCVLLGLLMYLAGRQRELSGRSRSGLALMAAGVAIGAPVGFLAKETAALFPLLVLCLEYTLLRDLPRSRHWRWFSGVFLWLPGLVVLANLLSYLLHAEAWYSLRSFTLGERLLTESRVLFMYLAKFFLPPLYGMRLYYDDLAISHSLLTPWTTAASLAGLAALVAAAIKWRRRAPVFAFAVCWYLTAHLIEATFIPLELAFDHRNYVALCGPAFALAWYGWHLISHAALRRVRPALITGAAAYGVFLAVAMWQAAAFWSQPWELANFWADQQPDSRRGQLVVTRFYWRLHLPGDAIASNERSLQRWPGDVSFFLSELETACTFPELPKPDLMRIPPIVARFDSAIPSTVGMLDELVTATEAKQCQKFTPAELWSVVEMVFEAPKLAPQEQNHQLLLSRIAALANDRPLARKLLDQAIMTAPPAVPVMLKNAAIWSLQAGDIVCARSYAARFQQQNDLRKWSHRKEFDDVTAWIERFAADPAIKPRPGDEPSCQPTPPEPHA